MKHVRPVEVLGFHMRKILKDSFNRPSADGLEPVLGDLHSWIVASSFGILVLPMFPLEDRWCLLVGFQVQQNNKQPQFILRSLTFRETTVDDAHKIGMLHVIR